MSNESASNEMWSMPPGRTSEREYLLEQQALAGLALRRMVTVITHDLAACADPALWVRKYPLRSTAAAFSLGFAITRSAGGTDDEAEEEARDGSSGAKARGRRKCTVTRRLLRLAGKALRTAIVGPIPFMH